MGKPLILVVDDEKHVADTIATIIRRTGRYEAMAVYSGGEALAEFSKNKIMLGIGGNNIRLAILDIKMPEMDGLQLLEKIRRQYSESIGVIMLTAFEDGEKWDRATSASVINYIKKPYDEKELIGTIDSFFAGKGEELTLKTFEKHIEKMEEWEKDKPAGDRPT
jgi:CheY-like chemotaxis protein